MRQVLLSALIVATLASLAGYGWDCFSTSYQREANLAAEKRLQEGLAVKVSLRAMAGQDRRLWDVLRHIGNQTAVPLWWDEAALTMRGDSRTDVVRVPDLELPLESALELILAQTDAVYYEDGSRIVISAEPLTEKYVLEVYPLPSLGGDSPAQQSQVDDWIDMLTLTIARESWADIGGGGTIEPFPGGLAIYQTQGVHRRIRELLQELTLAVPLAEASALSQERDALTKVLEETCSCQFVGEPLLKVVQELASRFRIPLTISRPKLEEAAIDWNVPITLSLHDIRLGSLLRILASQQQDCCWVTRRGVMELTTGEDAGSTMRTKAYDVQDLVSVEGGVDFDSLQDLIMTMVSPDRWDEMSGPGPIQPLFPGWIIFEQTEEIHRETAELLALLRQGLARRPEKSVNRRVSLPPSPAEQNIAAALSQKVIFKYRETPLRKVAEDISALTGINVLLDIRALEEYSISPHEPVTCNLPPLPLSDALKRLTGEGFSRSLGWLVRNDCIFITSHTDASVEQSLILLDARDFVSRSPNRLDLERLEDRVRLGIEPPRWNDVGAAGRLSTFRGILLVRGDRDLHQRVFDFLNSPSARGAPTSD